MSNIHQTTAYSQVVTSVVNIISANNTTLHSNNSTNITDLGFTEENAWNIVGWPPPTIDLELYKTHEKALFDIKPKIFQFEMEHIKNLVRVF